MVAGSGLSNAPVNHRAATSIIPLLGGRQAQAVAQAARRIRAVILTEQPVSNHLGPRRQRVHLGLSLLACVYASPRRPQKVVYCVQGALSEAAVCIFTYIETKAALGTSTLWAKATTRGPLTW